MPILLTGVFLRQEEVMARSEFGTLRIQKPVYEGWKENRANPLILAGHAPLSIPLTGVFLRQEEVMARSEFGTLRIQKPVYEGWKENWANPLIMDRYGL